MWTNGISFMRSFICVTQMCSNYLFYFRPTLHLNGFKRESTPISKIIDRFILQCPRVQFSMKCHLNWDDESLRFCIRSSIYLNMKRSNYFIFHSILLSSFQIVDWFLSIRCESGKCFSAQISANSQTHRIE